jgi:coenzyme F420-0:L-glutamate ligase/coenzyme F420-1:gamma-L-glutamate ligase
MRRREIAFRALPDVPDVAPGDNPGAIVVAALRSGGITLQSGDILVVAQKIVSKSEGRFVDLAGIVPSQRASAIAVETGKDPRFVEQVLRESSAVVRVAPNVLITRHRLGFVMANAGIDRSNIGATGGDDWVLLLPADPDASARAIGSYCATHLGVTPGVIISDSFGRPWRQGVVNVAIGAAGLPVLVDLRGHPDRDGRALQMTQVAVADAVAAGAGLVLGEAADSVPIVHVRGLDWWGPAGDGQTLIRPPEEDLFR